MLQASKEWRWVQCHTQNRLLVDLGDELQLCTPFRLRQLTADSESLPNFSVEEAEFYQNVFDYLRTYAVWSEAQCCQISLNATAVKFHLLPMQAKSWFFTPYRGTDILCNAVISLQSKEMTGECLIVDHDSEASLCVNLTADFRLDENIVLEQFQAIKVLNNRIHPLMVSNKLDRRA
ncbi:cell division protein ZapC [Pseudoalteromonas luteoviolacea]|uniref:Cell division protein ZapC n=1 Tax=Pseudoalteromonas luteoviolacea TaxID=43657 RepID=A0A1C0TUJ2_9GAMM|nr:cell division protein ZapC domain-containing protein [Pseudoalteromonas luteoviolacea]MBQ4812598.1 cell division protein ZapC [Pseudoalteromonas luteoviolacea]OCQ22983.1 cell division protein ZapC [Pseudoalteromonas luteoviolacea]